MQPERQSRDTPVGAYDEGGWRKAPGESRKEYEMTPHLKPHAAEWFKALETANPRQAAHTKHILSLAGSDAVCSICGDEANRDYKLVNEETALSPVSTMRLCDVCLDIRRSGVARDSEEILAGASRRSTERRPVVVELSASARPGNHCL
jgi:hypothetical protein